MVPERSYTPPSASIDEYQAMLFALGIERGVIVQPSFYGTDNRCTQDAVRASQGSFRGIAVVGADVDPGLLADMTGDGFCGARFNLLFNGGPSLEVLENVAAKVARFGWHVQLLMDIRQLPAIETRIAGLPCTVVFDHLGHFPVPVAGETGENGFAALERLMQHGHTWVKLSGGYRLSTQPVPYSDLSSYAQRLCNLRPDRLIWGSDWPHTAVDGKMPNDGQLLDTLAHWVPDQTIRNRILVNNPAALYDFPI
jgi:2-pyrone-4,6-dicarboxylate lactonase